MYVGAIIVRNNEFSFCLGMKAIKLMHASSKLEQGK